MNETAPPAFASAGSAFGSKDRHGSPNQFQADDPLAVVTLVHGTWAPHAGWIEPDSSLCQAFRASLLDRVTIFPFHWSGHNTAHARWRAADALAKDLESRTKQWPTAKHFVVAHSHGGNVALYALRSNWLRSRIAGVACLSTPFIHARPRGFGAAGSIQRRAVLMIALMLMLSGFVAILRLPLPRFSQNVIVLFVGSILSRRWSVSADHFCEHLALPLPDEKQLLILRAPGDEASEALAASSIVGWIMSRAWRLIGRIVPRPEVFFSAKAQRESTPKWVWWSFWGAIIFISVGTLGAHPPAWVNVTWTAITIALAAAVASWILFRIVQLCASVLLLCLAVGISLTLFPFGPDLVLEGIFLDVTAEPTPPGNWESTLISDEPDDTGRLAHSRTYSDAAAIHELVMWVGRHLSIATHDASVM